MADTRRQQLQDWARQQLSPLHGDSTVASAELEMVSGDASFRRYFRMVADNQPYIAVDAPPEHEDNTRFVNICQMFLDAGTHAPTVQAQDFEQGFLLLEDLGDALYLDTLLRCQEQGDIARADELYRQAIDALVQFQHGIEKEKLDPFDSSELQREMRLFDEWFCEGLLGLELNTEERLLIQSCFDFLEQAALQQTEVAVHRDYHSRNLLITQPNPGIIDFQDAVAGAYSYDLVSLLRDCYIRWDEARLTDWLVYYHQLASERGVIQQVSLQQLRRDFDLMGLQRHLKVMGIFCRLFLRDKKSRYLADIPLVMNYFLEVAECYPELDEFVVWFKLRVTPVAQEKLAIKLATD